MAGALLTALGASPAQAATQVNQDLPVSTMHYRWVSIPAGATYTWETTDLSVGADSVMHLWDWSTLDEVGYDDDGGAGLASQVSYTNLTGSQKSIVLIVRSYSTGTQGTARLLQNGVTLASSIPVAGRRITVENGAGYEHETVKAPGGAEYPYLLALDSSLHLVDLDYTSGVGYQAKVEHASTQYVVIGTTSGSGNVHLYSNDPTDYDGDGVGYGLEWDLGTCDVASWSHCTGVHNLADTDRDGIPDGAEVFGVDSASSPQHLAAWGADPRHKDVFVELDYSDAFPGQPFTEGDAVAAAAIYAAGDAAAIINPDSMDGVRIHLDVGFDPADPDLATLLGDWGGSGPVPDGTAYGVAPDTYRDPVRAGIFHYGLMSQGSGGGQGWQPGDRFGWGVSMGNRYVRSFAHELGHNLNLAHSGHSSWGNVNGKANYLSLMNYAFPGSSFSQGQSAVVLNPAAVDEQAGIGADASHVGVSPFYRLLGPSDEIDWDFDQEFSPGGWGSVRAPVTYATWSGTNAFTANEQDLHSESDLPATTPSLIRGPGNRLYAFYVDDERIYYRHALHNGNSWAGSCPGGDGLDDDCTTWSAAVEVPTSANARGLTAVYSEGQVLLAFRTQWDSLRTIRATGANATGTLTGWTSEIFHSVWTDKEPEAEFMRVDPAQFGGENLVVALFYRNQADGQYRWRTMANVSSASSTDRGALQTETGATLTGVESPTFTNWPYDPMTSTQGTTCGAITNNGGQVGLYCYDRASNRFENVSSSAFTSGTKPTTVGKPGLAFHAYRSWAGLPRDNDPSRGAFWLTVVVPDPNWDFVDVWISDPVSEAAGEDLQDVYFPVSRRGKVGNVWSNMVDGAGLALYDDPELGAMKGLWLRQDGGDADTPLGAVKLRFLPFADGTFRANLTDGNDFQVMERGICRGLASAAYCGPSSFGLD
ncbi:MAG: hypothetical protein KDK70_12060 [Myxococcales bacterium]|nr:hypothetical protein [Myxococcales bacterium]